jgi:2-methylfumaryl-CoA isomerase
VLLTNIGTPWLSHELLVKSRVDLISCTISGNPDGSTAVDYTVNAATGFPAMTGDGNLQAPMNHVLPAWDIACAYQAAFAIMAAVMQRSITGAGAELRLALSDVAFTTLSHLGLMAEAELLGVDRPSIGNHIYGAFGRDFGTYDRQRVMVAGISAAQWRALCTACELDTVFAEMDEATRFESREIIAEQVEAWCIKRDFIEVERVFNLNKVCWGRYRTVSDLIANDSRVSLANPVFERVVTPGIGEHRTAGATVSIVGVKRKPVLPAPWLGQHTEEVLAQVLGFSSGQIGGLFDSGIVAGPDRDPYRSNVT